MTIRLITPLALLLVSANSLLAQSPVQTTSSADFAQRMALRLNLSALSVGLEVQPIRKAPLTLMAEVGSLHGTLDLVFAITGTALGADTPFGASSYFFPLLKGRIEARYYTNLNRRLRLGKTTDYFSGNYVSAGFQFMGSPSDRKTIGVFDNNGALLGSETNYGNYYGFVHLGYGLQRSFGRNQRWFYDVQAGGQYLVYRYEYGVSGINASASRLLPQVRFGLGLRLR